MSKLTQAILKELLCYDPDTGVFTWKTREQRHFKTVKGCKVWNGRYAGKVAGYSWRNGEYRCIYIRIFRRSYSAHRLAWFYAYGEWPNEVMHDDQDGTNNRIKNLADGTRSENMKNKRLTRRNKSGVMGVHWDKQSSKWRVRICVDSRSIQGGMFFELEHAKKRVKELYSEYGFHINHGSTAVPE